MIGTIAGMGGAERQALYLVEELKRNPGTDVDVLTFQDGQALRPALAQLGVRVHVVEYHHLWPRFRRARALATMARLIRSSIRPDAILPFVGIHSKVMGLIRPFTGAHYCWWNQQDEGRDLNGTKLEKRILEKASHVISNSWAGRDFLIETYGLGADDVLVYNNGTPLPADTRPTGIWRNDSAFRDRALVTMIANITPYKDHATLLRAWKLVLERSTDNQPPVLVLAGSLANTSHVASIKNLAFDLGLSAENVRFAGTVEDTNALLADADLVVHSSVAEGCPNSVCEAMAMGRAVVATDIPGSRQALGDSGGDCFAPPGDFKALAQRILAFLDDDRVRAETGARNRARIESDFSVVSMNRFFLDRISEGLRSAGHGEPVLVARAGSIPA